VNDDGLCDRCSHLPCCDGCRRHLEPRYFNVDNDNDDENDDDGDRATKLLCRVCTQIIDVGDVNNKSEILI